MARDNSETVNRATSTDRFVGSRIRERRIMLGLSQQQMADLIGVTYQQTHKYEKGINRISAGRLYEIARALKVSVDFFYEGLNGIPPANGGSHENAMPDRQRMCLEVARNFARIKDPDHQEAVSHLARTLAESRPGGET